MTARRATNLIKGYIAEHLGVLILRHISAVADVPTHQDVGIDAMCTLSRRDGGLLYAEQSFGVQLKSSSVREIFYDENQVEWLENLDVPFFFGSVDRANSSLTLFSTEDYYGWRSELRSDTSNGVALCLDSGTPDIPQGHFLGFDEEQRPRIWLGPPLVTMPLSKMDDTAFLDRTYQKLSNWIIELARSKVLRDFGVYRTLTRDRKVKPKFAHISQTSTGTEDELDQILEAVEPILWRIGHLLQDRSTIHDRQEPQKGYGPPPLSTPHATAGDEVLQMESEAKSAIARLRSFIAKRGVETVGGVKSRKQRRAEQQAARRPAAARRNNAQMNVQSTCNDEEEREREDVLEQIRTQFQQGAISITVDGVDTGKHTILFVSTNSPFCDSLPFAVELEHPLASELFEEFLADSKEELLAQIPTAFSKISLVSQELQRIAIPEQANKWITCTVDSLKFSGVKVVVRGTCKPLSSS